MEANQNNNNEQNNILSSSIQGKYCFSSEEEKFFEGKINEGEKQIKNNNLDLNYYINIEQNLMKYIDENISEIDKKKHKSHLRFYLREKFFMTNFERRKTMINQIHVEFYNFLNSIQTIQNIGDLIPIHAFAYDKMNPNKNNNEEISSALKKIQDGIWTICVKKMLSQIENTYNLQKFPVFLLYNEKKILKYKISKILKIALDIPFDEVKISREYIHSYLTKCFRQFIDGETNLFEHELMDDDTKKSIFKLIYLSNKNYIKYHNNKEFFEENIKKYIYIIGLYKQYDELINEFQNYMIEGNQEDDYSIIASLAEKLQFNNCNLENESSHPFYYLIFSYSCLLNNLTQYIESTNNEGQIEVTTSFTPQLLCSAREREFLINLLDYIDKYLLSVNKRELCFKINYILENYVFSSLIKSYTKVLFDENNKGKIELNFNRIYELIKINTSTEEEIRKREKLGDNLDDFVFNVLSKEQIVLLNKEFKNFMSKSLNLSQNEIGERNKEDSSFASSLLTKMKIGINSISHQIISEDKISSLNMNNLKIIPHDLYNISTHICLCVYGIFYPDQSTIPIKNIWNNLTGDKRNVDFYFYNWQNEDNFYKTNVAKNVVNFMWNFVSKKGDTNYKETNKENMQKMITNNRKISKIYGKFLAYILATRSVFKFHSVSLLGYSLGCNVIKHCLKELKKLSTNGIKVNEIINNVIFIGGACKLEENDKHKNIFETISGKVINCFSFYDNIIKNYYSIDSVGTRRINQLKKDNNQEVYLPEIENVDLTSLKLNQDDYKNEIPNIISQIKKI